MVRKRRTSIGKIKPYIDVRNMKDIPKFESLISTGPVTVVLVYAGWCGHCQKLKDQMWDKMATSPNRGVNTAAVHYDMVENTSLKNAPIEGYPTIFEVKPTPKENVSTPIPTPQNETEMAEVLNIEEEPKNVSKNTIIMDNSNNKNNWVPGMPVKNNVKLNESMNINTNVSKNNVPANQLNGYTPANAESLDDTLPPNIKTDEYKDAISTVVKTQTMKNQQGGNLFESLLKIGADSAHAIVLAGSAAEISQRLKKRKASKTRRHKRVMKKKTRKH